MILVGSSVQPTAELQSWQCTISFSKPSLRTGEQTAQQQQRQQTIRIMTTIANTGSTSTDRAHRIALYGARFMNATVGTTLFNVPITSVALEQDKKHDPILSPPGVKSSDYIALFPKWDPSDERAPLAYGAC